MDKTTRRLDYSRRQHGNLVLAVPSSVLPKKESEGRPGSVHKILTIRAGVGLETISGTIHAYPTFAEMVRKVADRHRSQDSRHSRGKPSWCPLRREEEACVKTTKSWKWIGAAFAVLILLAAGRFLPLSEWLRAFQGWVKELGPAGMLLYAVLYIAVTLLLGPAWLLTLGAGFTYGLLRGVLLVWVSATAGAALAFLIARHLARARIEAMAKKNEKFEAIDRAIGEKGWKIVFLLRLSPLVPFVFSNYIYGLTGISFWPYVLASAVGMLPLTVLYTYIGAAGQAALSANRQRSPWEWGTLGLGLLATVVVTVYVSRLAKRELEKARLGRTAP